MVTHIVRRLFTTDDYHRMLQNGVLTEDDRVELIEGEVLAMSPIGSRHAACVKRLNRLLARGVGTRAIVSVQDPIHLSARSEPQPDLALLQPRNDFYVDAHPEPEDVLLVIEVAESSQDFDRATKIPLYAQAGISEVWLVDLASDCIQTYSQPSARGYGEIHQLWRGQTAACQAFPDAPIPVTDILG
ncbi:MAG: Uma2 family endonuclease [Chloroflexi bacterium]|nr:Uma2 family endonuclease [Chloroflexota bacterium]